MLSFFPCKWRLFSPCFRVLSAQSELVHTQDPGQCMAPLMHNWRGNDHHRALLWTLLSRHGLGLACSCDRGSVSLKDFLCKGILHVPSAHGSLTLQAAQAEGRLHWITDVVFCFQSPSQLPYGKALYSYEGKEPGDLKFNKGDVIILQRRVDEHWFHRELGGTHGFLPASYVQCLRPLPPAPPQGKALYDFEVDKDCLTFTKVGWFLRLYLHNNQGSKGSSWSLLSTKETSKL